MRPVRQGMQESTLLLRTIYKNHKNQLQTLNAMLQPSAIFQVLPSSLRLLNPIILLRRKLKPFPKQPRRPRNHRPHRKPDIRTRQNSNRKSLPRTIPDHQQRQHHFHPQNPNRESGHQKGEKNSPIQRNRHSPKPRPEGRPQRTAPDGISRARKRPHLAPHSAVDTMYVDQRCRS